MPQDEVLRLATAIDNVLPLGVVGAHVLASIVGQIISMSLAIGPVACLRTRALYQAINSATSAPISTECQPP